jgi:hypothetical protein
MIRKNFSRAKRIAICILLVVVVVAFTSQPALARDQEQTGSVDARGYVLTCCQFWFSFHFGITIINSEWFKAIYYNIIVNYEIRCWWYWALVMEVGYNSFKWEDTDLSNQMEGNFYVWNTNMTLRRYFGKEKVRLFINWGPGLYSPKWGSPRLGMKAGVGVDIQLSDRVYFEMGSDYHYMFLKKDDLFYMYTEKKFFFHAHGGFVIRLK